ncbi:phosphatidic acid phosphatase type 2/haloperoxidase [Radiomyces spectabilis]|uniref:phosphatidic acid phosphatase type 2/haloperoxidase n=1 Tax=Radiomyces spectabilis TaxID=64574 RepID=UPI00221E7DD4|nr:phosphatidic acid phosphatase type 2/haloperoxidase [Radiomyces spectabilis]KAI8379369.1 phosphatidic acid phosphatase type 2/haloperoxidase [Radiomyces spectabilis]
MPKKVVKSRASDVDAGTHDDRLYDKAFHPWRAKLRKMLLPIVRSETPWLAAMQKRIRTPTLDTYFVWTANLGTHTFFMIFLPLLVWFGNAGLGRSIACLTAFGVFWSGFFKDFMCLPRPLSPPVHRLTMSPSAALEYGFPSTHSTNSISVALYMVAMACESDLPPQSPARMACIIGSFVYAVSVVFGRIYCGMHSITDVIGGTLLAYVLFWVQWTFKDQFNEMFLSDSYFVFLSIPFCLILVGLHVCFMGVCIGLFPGSWLCYRSEYCTLGLSTAATSHYSSIVALIVILIKVILGVAILFIWRMACKRACYVILPPIYRVFNLPHRKFEIGARYAWMPCFCLVWLLN